MGSPQDTSDVTIFKFFFGLITSPREDSSGALSECQVLTACGPGSNEERELVASTPVCFCVNPPVQTIFVPLVQSSTSVQIASILLSPENIPPVLCEGHGERKLSSGMECSLKSPPETLVA